MGGKEHCESNGREDEEMDKVMYNLQINNGDFTTQEFESVKKRLRKVKLSGPEKIRSEVLERCDLDDIILDFANRLLKEDVKPKQ